MEFRKITFEDKDRIDSALRLHGVPNCDLAFANLMAWNNTFHAAICEVGGFIIIRYSDEDMGTTYTMPLGKGDSLPILKLLEKEAEESGEPLRLYALRDEDIAYLRTIYPDFGFFHLRERSDYVYRRSDLANLTGKKFQPKRNHVNKFRSIYNWEYSSLTSSAGAECLELVRAWRREKALSAAFPEHYIKELDDELRSIEFSFEHFDSLGLVGGEIRVDGRLAAFCYGSALSGDTFCTHIEKADERYEGIFAVINQEFARHLPENYIYIDREDDLGLSGLRYAKESYHPFCLLHKHIGTSLSPLQLEVRRLWLECFPEDTPPDAEMFLMTRFKEENMLNQWRDGRLVSMVHVIPFGDTAYFYAVATDLRYRRQGLSGGLIHKALERCREQGFSRVVLIPSDEKLARWYAGMGFSGHHPIHFHTGDEFDFFAICGDDYNFGTGELSKDFAMVLQFDGRILKPDEEINVVEKAVLT